MRTLVCVAWRERVENPEYSFGIWYLRGRSSFVDLRCVWVTMAGRVDRGLFNLLLSGEMIIDDGEEMGGGGDDEEERGWMDEYLGCWIKRMFGC